MHLAHHVLKLPSVLAKIFGYYRVTFRNSKTGQSYKLDLLVMENLFYNKNISRIFDLKGSTRNRHVTATGKHNEVLYDENLVECACLSLHRHGMKY